MNNMKFSDIFNGMKRAVAALAMVVACTAAVRAILPEDTVTIDGIQYRTDFYHHGISINHDPYHIPYEETYTLKYMRQYNLDNMSWMVYADRVGNDFVFFDGSKLPMFEYAANVHVPYVGYYTGEVWLQDTVKLKALPYPRNTKYHPVYNVFTEWEDEEGPKFDEKLTFIRTPRYAVVKQWFQNCTGLRTARIGAAGCVRTLAFENCTKLETVYFESSPYVDENAFKNCPNIRRVVLASKLPKKLKDPSPFDQEVYEKTTLYISADQIEATKQHPTWGRFLNIHDIQEYISGVETVEADAEVEYEVYNMSGVQVRTACSGREWREGLPPGVYIVRSSRGDVRKEQVR